MLSETAVIHEIRDTPAICHCSSVVESENGHLICVWYEGAYETSTDEVIKVSYRKSPDEAWTPGKTLLQLDGVPLGNPVIFSFDRKTLYMIYSVLLGESWEESVMFLSESIDGGYCWTNPSLLYGRRGLMAKTKPIRLDSGRILVPLYNEIEDYPVVLIVEDTEWWAKSRYVAETMARGRVIQPAIVQLSNGKLLMLCRTSEGFMWKSLSPNGGLSWTICKPTNIPNPNAALDLVRARGGELLMAFNNSCRDRYSISLALSEDDGKTWSCLVDFDGGEGEYSYPCLIQDESGKFHVTYTEDRYRIKHLEFDLEWLEKNRLEKPLETD